MGSNLKLYHLLSKIHRTVPLKSVAHLGSLPRLNTVDCETEEEPLVRQNLSRQHRTHITIDLKLMDELERGGAHVITYVNLKL